MNLQFTTTDDAKRYVLSRFAPILKDFGVTRPITARSSVKNLDEDFGLDSLDEIEILMCIEEELDIEISDDEAVACNTFDDIVNVCVSKLKIANPDPVVTNTVSTKNDVKPYNNEIGILLLPSLEQHGRVVRIDSVSLNEALEFVDQFTENVISRRKTKEFKNYPNGDKVTNMQLFSNIIDNTQMSEIYVKDSKYLDADLSKLIESKIPKTRGLRPIFVSNTIVGVGTTVIYNQNWATINFEDDSILTTLQRIQEKYKKPEENDEDSSYYSSYDSSW